METGGEAAAGVQDRRLLGDLLEKGFSPGEGEKGGGKGRALASPSSQWPRVCQTSAGRTGAHRTPRYGRARASPPPAHARTNAILSHPGSTDLSWPSLFLLFLLLRAILVLELFFRAGPILMEVFSRAVVRRATLLPL